MLRSKVIGQLVVATFLFQGCIPLPKLNETETYYSDKPVVMFILDTSRSMEKIENGEERLTTAKASIIDTINKIDDQRYNTSIITFKGDCDSQLLVPPNNNVSSRIIEKIRYLNADGGTPLAATIAYTGSVLRNVKKKKVILLSDGEETCGGDPVKEAKILYHKYNLNINFQVIGYAVDNKTKKMLQEISNISPDWKYYDAKDAQSMNVIINNILKEGDLAKDGWNGNKYTFQFDSDSVNLTTEYRKKIYTMFEFLKDNNDNILIKGYTDARGTKAYNKRLSIKRANIVKKYLIELGISNNRIKVQGMGEDNPIATNNTKDGRRMNRRVTIETIKKY